MLERRPAREDAGAIAHVPALDGVRGIAVALVLALHFGVAADLPLRFRSEISIWIERLLYAGWAGVDLFFVLSGFLITTILLASKDGPQYFRRFYGRRVLRIFPLYYTALVLGLIVLPRLIPGGTALLPEDASGRAWLWTYTINIGLTFGLIASPIAVFSHFWTLAIEEQFYLAWPWLVKATSARTLLRLCGLVMAGALALRLAWVGLGFGWEGAYWFTLARADALAIGGAAAVLMRDGTWRDVVLRLSASGLFVGIAIVAAMFSIVPRFYPTEWIVVTFGHSAIAFASACLIVVALRDRPGAWLTAAPLRSLGKYSYGIYVWHFPLQRVLLGWYATRPAEPSAAALMDALVFVSAGLLGSLLLGWTSYHLIERPFLRLKRFFGYTGAAVLDQRGPADSILAASGR